MPLSGPRLLWRELCIFGGLATLAEDELLNNGVTTLEIKSG
ncbi:hypothetical protein [Pseudomonas sp.]|nr:hypothetical protein [Pseudomonas sp.]HUE90821.1 hypothetical protein [Pseudomonas sp.]